MKIFFWGFAFSVLLLACGTRPGPEKNNTGADKVFKLRLKPVVGTNYDYDIDNESTMAFEVGDKKIENIVRSKIGTSYMIGTDSLGNYLVTMKYKSIHIHTKNNGEESDIDASNAVNSIDQTEKMLGMLKDASIRAAINPSGDIVRIDGYQQVADQFIAQMNNGDLSAKSLIQKQWKDLVEQKLVKTNIDQLFKVFPDSAIHVGDKWKMFSKEKADINFEVRNFFTLESISNGIAYVKSQGTIVGDSTATSLMGVEVTPTISGEQTGEYEVDIKSGMISGCRLKTQINGQLTMMGRDIPIDIKRTIKITGEKK